MEATFFSFAILLSSPIMYSFAFGFSQRELKSPDILFSSAQRSSACLLGLTTATRKDSKLLP